MQFSVLVCMFCPARHQSALAGFSSFLALKRDAQSNFWRKSVQWIITEIKQDTFLLKTNQPVDVRARAFCGSPELFLREDQVSDTHFFNSVLEAVS